MWKKITLSIIISAFLLLWIYTGINKLLDYEETLVQMQRSPFIESMAGFLSYAVPIGELALAGLLIFQRTRLLGLYGSLFAMALFTGYIWLMLNYAYDLPCSCGGIISKMSWEQHLTFNAIFTGLAIVAILLASSPVPKQKNNVVTMA